MNGMTAHEWQSNTHPLDEVDKVTGSKEFESAMKRRGLEAMEHNAKTQQEIERLRGMVSKLREAIESTVGWVAVGLFEEDFKEVRDEQD